MGNLNCKRASRNMPLFVAGDLSGDLDREMVNHLATCEECGRLAQEFRVSNSLLTEAWAAPEFGAQFYDEIRNNVLDQITRDRLSSEPRFGHKWMYAAAFALMLVASTVMFVRWRAAKEVPSDSAAIRQGAGNTASNRGPNAAVPLTPKEPPRKFQRVWATQKPARRMRLSPADIKQLQSAKKVDPPVNGPHVSPKERASESEVSRIEIQTSNPNIRIIWLVTSDKRGAQEDNQYKGEPDPRINNR